MLNPHGGMEAPVKNKNPRSLRSNCVCEKPRLRIPLCFHPDDREYSPTLRVCATHPGPLPSNWYWLWTTWPRCQSPEASRHNSKDWPPPPWDLGCRLVNQGPEEMGVPVRGFGREVEEMEGMEKEEDL